MIAFVLMMLSYTASPSEIVQLHPARKLICTIDPERITSNGKPIDPKIMKAKYPQFSLSIDNAGSPIEIEPRNLSAARSDLIHLTEGVPKLQGELVVMDISYEHPLIVIPPTQPGKPPVTMGKLLTMGQLIVNPMYLNFTLKQSLKVELNLQIPETSRQDLHIQAKGTCVERAFTVDKNDST